MRPLVNIIVLALMLLLSQTAVAVHDIHCLEGEHDQMCETYFTQDQSASSDIGQNQFECMAYGEKPDSFTTVISPTIFISLYLSRAPPYYRI